MDIKELQNELILLRAARDGAVSLLLDVQRDCINAKKQIIALTNEHDHICLRSGCTVICTKRGCIDDPDLPENECISRCLECIQLDKIEELEELLDIN